MIGMNASGKFVFKNVSVIPLAIGYAFNAFNF